MTIRGIFLIIALLLPFFSNAKEIRLQQLGFKEGLLQMNIRSLWQDELGCMWIGTSEGLIRYNGNLFDNIPVFSDSNPGYPSSIISICGDDRGHLYFYMKAGRNCIIEYDLRTETYKQVYEEILGAVNMQYCSGRLLFSIEDRIYTYTEGKLELYHTLSDNISAITAIRESSDGVLYFGTQSSGLYRLSRERREEPVLEVASKVGCIFEDHSKRMWIGSQSDGLYMLAPDGTSAQYTARSQQGRSVSNDDVRAICEDDHGYIWIGTISGLDRFDPQNLRIDHHGMSMQKNYRLSHPAIWSLFKDNQGNIWVATYYGGINYFNPNDGIFDFYDFTETTTISEYPIVSSIVEDNDGNFWIGTEGTGLLCIDKQKRLIHHYKKGKDSLSQNIIKSLYFDAAGNKLWIGTYYGGLNCLNLKTGSIDRIPVGDGKGSISTQSVEVIVPRHNYLYLGTLSGVYRFDKTTGLSTPVKAINERVTVVFDICIDRQGNLWIAGSGLYRYNSATEKLDNFHNIIKYVNASSFTVINDLALDSQGRVLIGTAGAGVVIFDPATNQYTEFNQINSGLENNYISCIYESPKGSIIAGTNSSLSFINEDQRRCFNYNVHNGFPLLSMMSGVISSRDDGKLIIGGINGICLLDEEALRQAKDEVKLRFDKLWINNQPVAPGDGTKALENSLPFTRKVKLNHNQNNFTVHIASDNYIRCDISDFQYRLDPFDKQWINLKSGAPINYMNLPTGSYKLKVRRNTMYNPDHNDEISLDVEVTPPLYATWYAYLAYTVFFLLIALWVIYFTRSKLLLQASLLFERKDKERRELDNQSKLRFFTYVSHEFRTPITLIVNHLEILMKSARGKTGQSQELTVAHRNAQKLIGLINELLDFRKQDQGFLRLTVAEDNIVQFVRDIYDSFATYAVSKQIRFGFSSRNGEINLTFDHVQLQKVFNNLLSNAFKYTKPGAGIDVEICDHAEYVTVSVKDSGIGISKEAIGDIFDRFYQVTDGPNEYIAGSGLGLALSKGIVELHSGKIEVESELGKGSEFIVTLPKGAAHFENNDKVRISENRPILGINAIEADPQETLAPQEDETEGNKLPADSPTILVVEDDDDLRDLLRKLLSPMYRIAEASNGLQGYEAARKKQPDLIVSDVMMPEMSGTRMCAMLKDNFETCHIPVILLTAQSTAEHNIKGLKCGADDFVSKPFNSAVLMARCHNLLNNRRVLQEKYAREIGTAPQIIATNPADQRFIEKAVQIIKDNITDKKINVDFLCSEMSVGRRLFFNKMKSIAGQTPNEFILAVKYKVAASMLQERPDMYISEISDMLGFSSPKYFGKGFKEHFGVSPKEMKESLESKKQPAD